MLTEVLAGLFLLLTGALAGVLMAVAVAVVPMMSALPGERWVQVHRLLDPGFDPLMPRANKVTLAIGVVLAIIAPGVAAKTGFALAVLCVVGVAFVSERYNVRMNRHIDTWDDELPAGWTVLRTRWAVWNQVRTLIAVIGFAAAIAASMFAWA
jgi:uncharacterized membrane protein